MMMDDHISQVEIFLPSGRYHPQLIRLRGEWSSQEGHYEVICGVMALCESRHVNAEKRGVYRLRILDAWAKEGINMGLQRQVRAMLGAKSSRQAICMATRGECGVRKRAACQFNALNLRTWRNDFIFWSCVVGLARPFWGHGATHILEKKDSLGGWKVWGWVGALWEKKGQKSFVENFFGCLCFVSCNLCVSNSRFMTCLGTKNVLWIIFTPCWSDGRQSGGSIWCVKIHQRSTTTLKDTYPKVNPTMSFHFLFPTISLCNIAYYDSASRHNSRTILFFRSNQIKSPPFFTNDLGDPRNDLHNLCITWYVSSTTSQHLQIL